MYLNMYYVNVVPQVSNIMLFDTFLFKGDEPDDMAKLNGIEVDVGAGMKL